VCGYCFKAFYKESFLLPIVLAAAADFYASVMFYIFNILLRGYFNVIGFLTSVMLPELVYTVIISAFLYRLIYYIMEIINNRSEYKRRLF
ncbi:MAG: rod shape-determining protein MreD, partial [Clostridiales bacterium]|nr:rod shape-determining protein MreD [Clostridiales bacterium]